MLTLDIVGVLDDGSPVSFGVLQNPRKTLSFPIGADVLLRARIIGIDGSPVPLGSPASLLFTLKKRFSDTDAQISRAATIESAGDGLASFRFVPIDTKNLSPGQFAYDIWLTDALGNRSAVVPTSPFILEPAVTVPGQVGNVPFFPPAPPPAIITPSGWLSVVDVAVVGGLATNKVWDDAPNNTIIQSADISGLSLNVTVKSSAPHVLVGATPAVLPPHVTGAFYVGVVPITVVGSGNVVAQLTTPDGQPGAFDTVALNYVPPPSITALDFIGGYPGAQTELKAGDTFQVQGTTNTPAVAVEVQDFGAAIFGTPTFPSATSFLITVTIADRGTSPQSLVARMRAQNAAGAFGPLADTASTVVLNNLHPTVTFGAKTYPLGQLALKGSETADVAVTLANLDSVAFDSPNGDLSILNPTLIEASKTVTRIAGVYNVATNNLRGTATRNANAAVTVGQTVVSIAHAFPTVNVTVPAARLRSGGNDGTAVQGHTVSIVADQQLLNAPSVDAGVGGGTFIGGGFAGGPSTWTRTLNVHDNDVKGGYSFSNLVATNLAGLVQTTINSGAAYTLGGFVQRTLTFGPFSQSTTLNVGVVTYSKLQAGIFTSTNQPAIRNAVQGDHSNLLNTYTVDSLGNVGPTNLWWNDVAAAGANSGGTAQITAVEEIV